MKIRILYKKKSPAHMISHLDFLKVLERIIRRANIPIEYSQGFNPHPKLSFSFALSLGIESEYEWFEMDLLIDHWDKSWIDQLNRHTINGIHFIEGQQVQDGSLPLSKLHPTAWYDIAFLDWVPIFDNRLQSFQNSSTFKVQRKSKKNRIYEVDYKELVHEVKMIDQDNKLIRLNLENNSSQFLNPNDFLTHVLFDTNHRVFVEIKKKNPNYL